MKKRIYFKTLNSIIDKGKISISDKILIVCGGEYDKKVLCELGFNDVTISNLDIRMNENSFDPYKWNFLDAENLELEPDSFDWVFVHAGLHHCYSPHKAIIEMLRIGRKGILVFEARDSWIMKLAIKFKLVPEYEIEAVIGNKMKFGGVANSIIPNHIYRWRENEIEKIVKSYLPQYKNNLIEYFYHLRLPYQRLSISKTSYKIKLAKLISIPLRIIIFFFPKLSNEFCFFVRKGDILHDWLSMENELIQLNKNYLQLQYKLSDNRD